MFGTVSANADRECKLIIATSRPETVKVAVALELLPCSKEIRRTVDRIVKKIMHGGTQNIAAINPKNEKFEHYGARGIRMCRQWKNSFAQFKKDMGNCPKGFTLDRRDVNKGYSPNNCRWIKYGNQAANQRKTIWVTLRGKTTCLKRACAIVHVGYVMTRWRMKRFNLTAEKAIELSLSKGLRQR